MSDFVDKKRWVGGTEKMDGGQNKQNCVHVVIECPHYFCLLGAHEIYF